MVIDEFYQRCMSCDFGKQCNKIAFRFGTKTLHILPDVFFLPFPHPLSPAHAHEEKYGWLARLPRPVQGLLASTSLRRRPTQHSLFDSPGIVPVPSYTLRFAGGPSHVSANDGFPFAWTVNSYRGLSRRRGNLQQNLGQTPTVPTSSTHPTA